MQKDFKKKENDNTPFEDSDLWLFDDPTLSKSTKPTLEEMQEFTTKTNRKKRSENHKTPVEKLLEEVPIHEFPNSPSTFPEEIPSPHNFEQNKEKLWQDMQQDMEECQEMIREGFSKIQDDLERSVHELRWNLLSKFKKIIEKYPKQQLKKQKEILPSLITQQERRILPPLKVPDRLKPPFQNQKAVTLLKNHNYFEHEISTQSQSRIPELDSSSEEEQEPEPMFQEPFTFLNSVKDFESCPLDEMSLKTCAFLLQEALPVESPAWVKKMIVNVTTMKKMAATKFRENIMPAAFYLRPIRLNNYAKPNHHSDVDNQIISQKEHARWLYIVAEMFYRVLNNYNMALTQTYRVDQDVREIDPQYNFEI